MTTFKDLHVMGVYLLTVIVTLNFVFGCLEIAEDVV